MRWLRRCSYCSRESRGTARTGIRGVVVGVVEGAQAGVGVCFTGGERYVLGGHVEQRTAGEVGDPDSVAGVVDGGVAVPGLYSFESD